MDSTVNKIGLIQRIRRTIRHSFWFNLYKRPRLTFLSYLNRKGWIMNEKQKAWSEAMSMISDRSAISVLETGRARNRHWSYTDGNSTFFFAHLANVRRLISIDNDSEDFTGFSGTKEYCEHYLPNRDREVVELINGDSVTQINSLGDDVVLDFVLLDSANDPDVTFREYQAVKRLLSPKGAVVCIDDVSGSGKKGDIVVPYLISQGLEEHRYEAAPNGCSVFFIPPS